jgi:hypothetical protein
MRRSQAAFGIPRRRCASGEGSSRPAFPLVEVRLARKIRFRVPSPQMKERAPGIAPDMS